jgi:hypothetical protein
MALGSTMPLTEMVPGKTRPARKTDLTAICEPIVWKMWQPRHPTALWASGACYGASFTFLRTDHPPYESQAESHSYLPSALLEAE